MVLALDSAVLSAAPASLLPSETCSIASSSGAATSSQVAMAGADLASCSWSPKDVSSGSVDSSPVSQALWTAGRLPTSS